MRLAALGEIEGADPSAPPIPQPHGQAGSGWGLLAEYADELAGIPQSKCGLRFSPSAEVPLETLRKIMTDAVERKRAG